MKVAKMFIKEWYVNYRTLEYYLPLGAVYSLKRI